MIQGFHEIQRSITSTYDLIIYWQFSSVELLIQWLGRQWRRRWK